MVAVVCATTAGFVAAITVVVLTGVLSEIVSAAVTVAALQEDPVVKVATVVAGVPSSVEGLVVMAVVEMVTDSCILFMLLLLLLGVATTVTGASELTCPSFGVLLQLGMGVTSLLTFVSALAWASPSSRASAQLDTVASARIDFFRFLLWLFLLFSWMEYCDGSGSLMDVFVQSNTK